MDSTMFFAEAGAGKYELVQLIEIRVKSGERPSSVEIVLLLKNYVPPVSLRRFLWII